MKIFGRNLEEYEYPVIYDIREYPTLDELTDVLWRVLVNPFREKKSPYRRYKEEPDTQTTQQKASKIAHNLNEFDDCKAKYLFSMLYDLDDSEYPSRYWHSTDHWDELKPFLSGIEQEYYAKMIIEKAAGGHKRYLERDDSWGGRYGHAWIVRKYNDGTLKEFISQELLEESVNQAFWEIANTVFVDETHEQMPEEYYEDIMKHSQYLDLTRLDEFKKEPLTIDRYWWVEDQYKKAVQRAKDNLPKESMAWLARPILEDLFVYAFSWENHSDEPITDMEKELEDYKEYIDTEIIQDMIKEKITISFQRWDNDEHNEYSHTWRFDYLRNHLKMSDKEVAEHLSSNFPEDRDFEITLIKEQFPIKYLNSEAIERVQEKAIKHVHDNDWIFIGSKATEPLVPHLNFIDSAIQQGYLEKIVAKPIIEGKVKAYINRKRRPAGDLVVHMLSRLNPNAAYNIDKDLYKEAVHKGISDLVLRNKLKEASQVYTKAEEQGWLDKTKVPDIDYAAHMPEPDPIQEQVPVVPENQKVLTEF